ncbi:MAG: glycoside hydrolase family 3 C-terminal domain-containing protein [Clostridia bacterium]|nr:glycoside hydrolase family 3 C-terminal domain-containing protein [Clostridia bacterium]
MRRTEARKLAKKLVDQMTLEERASQLKYNAPAIDRLGIPAYNWWNEALHGVARAGTATVFPQAIALAAIFDADFHRRVADVIATEGRAKYNARAMMDDRDIYKGLTFWSPNINIFRDPRWGRGQETYGEDPYLTGRLGAAFIRGLQGDGEYLKSAACAKHFAVHSGPEARRHEFDAVSSDFDLWDTYLPAFEVAVKEAGVEAVMGAYNRINGVPACGHPMIEQVLREKWGFEGHFVSDCGAIADIHMRHKYTDTAVESAALALNAGCDLNCGNVYLSVMEAHQEGLVSEAAITEACVRLFTTRYMLGLFDENCPYNQIEYAVNDCDAHQQLALEAARRCMVLLKNDGILPLDREKIRSVAVIGPNANSIVALEGNYNGTSSRYVTFLEGVRQAFGPEVRVEYSMGSHLYRNRIEDLSQPDQIYSEAVCAANHADVTILVVGLDSTIEGEEGDASNEYGAGDKRDLMLPETQRGLVEAVMATGKPVVTVVASGSALNVAEGNAVIQAWYPGQAGGTALAEILLGEVNPSGKLPVTFYRSEADLPDFEDYSMANRTYRYFKGEALYPFGYGLSYTRYGYERPEYDAAENALYVSVRNDGDRAGEEVVEAYLKILDADVHGLNHRLCAFGRVALQPGEEKRVKLPLAADVFESVREDGTRAQIGGKFRFYLGGSQPDSVSERLTGAAPVSVDVER